MRFCDFLSNNLTVVMVYHRKTKYIIKRKNKLVQYEFSPQPDLSIIVIVHLPESEISQNIVYSLDVYKFRTWTVYNTTLYIYYKTHLYQNIYPIYDIKNPYSTLVLNVNLHYFVHFQDCVIRKIYIFCNNYWDVLTGNCFC